MGLPLHNLRRLRFLIATATRIKLIALCDINLKFEHVTEIHSDALIWLESVGIHFNPFDPTSRPLAPKIKRQCTCIFQEANHIFFLVAKMQKVDHVSATLLFSPIVSRYFSVLIRTMSK
jgi:hypothetical protein